MDTIEDAAPGTLAGLDTSRLDLPPWAKPGEDGIMVSDIMRCTYRKELVLPFLASSGVSIGPVHLTSGEAWYVFGLLTGLLFGIHMAQPKYLRRRE